MNPGAGGQPDDLLTIAVDRPRDGVVVLRLAGEIDMLTAPRLARRLESAVRSGPQHVIVDLTGVSFLGSHGIAALLTAARELPPAVWVTGIEHNRRVRSVLDITGTGTALGVLASTDRLLAALAAAPHGRDAGTRCR